MYDIAGIIAILSIFIGAPSVVFSFIYKNSKNKREKEIEKLKYQKEILELEIQKKLLEEDDKKWDLLNKKETT